MEFTDQNVTGILLVRKFKPQKITASFILLFILTGSLNIFCTGVKIMEKATFAGGCFWCMESPFEKIKGVKEVIAGYTGGKQKNPTYEDVSSGLTGHREAVEITYDPTKVSYTKLLDVFWRQIDPTDEGGQFVDRGSQYHTAIFYHNEEQRIMALKSKRIIEDLSIFNKPVKTEIIPAGEFYPAETYHQDYYKTCPLPYKTYRQNSGRESYIKQVWDKIPLSKTEFTGKSSNVTATLPTSRLPKLTRNELKTKLTPIQYKVTQENGTEPPFQNEYWNNKKTGIYVDLISGEPLFSSRDKFDSGTGWPSFTQPIEPDKMYEKKDYSLSQERTEVRSKHADAHLGHLFKDGPLPTGLRYCINSASLRFIPKENLEKEGYLKYKKLFE